MMTHISLTSLDQNGTANGKIHRHTYKLALNSYGITNRQYPFCASCPVARFYTANNMYTKEYISPQFEPSPTSQI